MNKQVPLAAILLVALLTSSVRSQEVRQYVDISNMSESKQKVAMELLQSLQAGSVGEGDWHLTIKDGEVEVVPIKVVVLGSRPPDPPGDPTMDAFKESVKTSTSKLGDSPKKTEVAELLRSLVQQQYQSVDSLKTSTTATVRLLTNDDKWHTWLEEVDAAVQSAGYSELSEVKVAYSAVADVLEGQ